MLPLRLLLYITLYQVYTTWYRLLLPVVLYSYHSKFDGMLALQQCRKSLQSTMLLSLVATMQSVVTGHGTASNPTINNSGVEYSYYLRKKNKNATRYRCTKLGTGNVSTLPGISYASTD